MPDPRYAQEMQTAQNRVMPPGGGMGSSQVSPPPQGTTQQPLPGGQPGMAAGAGETPGFRDMITQVEDILVQGNQADLQVFGEFIGRLQDLAQNHEQQQPAAGGMPGQGMPQQGAPQPMM